MPILFRMSYQATIGLEIHAELATKTKMFCGCQNGNFDSSPNAHTCPICLGHPGTLPVPNKRAIDLVIKTGLAFSCSVDPVSKFDRKNYFYPDLPKAYQISQYDMPLCRDGRLIIPKTDKTIRIRRIHLEEDTGKLFHSADGKHSLVNFNRAGVPLMELVTEPDISSTKEAVDFAKEFQLIVKYLGVSDADMERGNMRVEVNISLKRDGENGGEMGTKVEVKNLNSFRAVAGAIEYEIERQTALLEKGKKIDQETRGWDEAKEVTVAQRSKEEAHDYRYFPEPDIPPFSFDEEYLSHIRSEIVELPQQRRERFASEYNLSAAQADLLTQDIFTGDFFEETVSELKALAPSASAELIYNYLTSDVKGMEKEKGMLLSESSLKPRALAQVIFFLLEKKISSRVAKDALLESFETGKSPENILKEENLFQMDDALEMENIVDKTIEENDKVCADYRNGKKNALQFLIGKVMAQTKGKANPETIKDILERKLTS